MLAADWKTWIEERRGDNCILSEINNCIILIRLNNETNNVIYQLTCYCDGRENLIIQLIRYDRIIDNEIILKGCTESRLMNHIKKPLLKFCQGMTKGEAYDLFTWKTADDVLRSVYLEPCGKDVIIRSQSCDFVITDEIEDVCSHCCPCPRVPWSNLDVKNEGVSTSPDINDDYDDVTYPNEEEEVGSQEHLDLSCPKCSETCKSQTELLEHIKICSDSGSSASTPKKDSAVDNEEDCGRKLRKVISFYDCNKCSKTFKYKAPYLRHKKICLHSPSDDLKTQNKHVRVKRPLGGFYNCDKCDRSFKYESVWNKHLLVCCVETIGNECDICFKKLETPRRVQQHSTYHSTLGHSNLPVICPVCAHTSSDAASFNVHYEEKHSEGDPNTVCCAICFRRINKSKLWSHYMAIHSGENKHLCPHCGKKFRFASIMRTHVAKHENKFQFVCDQCGTAFSSLYGLSGHLDRFHLDNAKHVCDFCSKKFVRLIKFQEHLRVHMGIKPYKCKLCAFQSGKKFNVKIHCKRVHHVLDFSYDSYVETTSFENVVKNENAS